MTLANHRGGGVPEHKSRRLPRVIRLTVARKGASDQVISVCGSKSKLETAIGHGSDIGPCIVRDWCCTRTVCLAGLERVVMRPFGAMTAASRRRETA